MKGAYPPERSELISKIEYGPDELTSNRQSDQHSYDPPYDGGIGEISYDGVIIREFFILKPLRRKIIQ
jgi:hypothetical protein